MLLIFVGIRRKEMFTCYVKITYCNNENVPCCVVIKKENFIC